MKCVYWWIIVFELCILVFGLTGAIGIFYCQRWWSRDLLDLQPILDSNTKGDPYPAVPGWGTFPGWVMASTFFGFGITVTLLVLINIGVMFKFGGSQRELRGNPEIFLMVTRVIILLIAIVCIILGNMFRSSNYYSYYYWYGSWNWMKDDLINVLNESMKAAYDMNATWMNGAPFFCSRLSWQGCAGNAYLILVDRWYDFGNWAIGFGIGVSFLIMFESFAICLYAQDDSQWGWWRDNSCPPQQAVVVEGGVIAVQPDGTQVYVVQQGQPVVVQGAPQQGTVVTQGQPVQGVSQPMVQGQPVYQQPVQYQQSVQ